MAHTDDDANGSARPGDGDDLEAMLSDVPLAYPALARAPGPAPSASPLHDEAPHGTDAVPGSAPGSTAGAGSARALNISALVRAGRPVRCASRAVAVNDARHS